MGRSSGVSAANGTARCLRASRLGDRRSFRCHQRKRGRTRRSCSGKLISAPRTSPSTSLPSPCPSNPFPTAFARSSRLQIRGSDRISGRWRKGSGIVRRRRRREWRRGRGRGRERWMQRGRYGSRGGLRKGGRSLRGRSAGSVRGSTGGRGRGWQKGEDGRASGRFSERWTCRVSSKLPLP